MTSPYETIYRFELPIQDEVTIETHFGAEFLTVGPPRNRTDTNNYLDLWARVDRSYFKRSYKLFIVGTGNPMPEGAGKYIGSVTTHNALGVWHVFAERRS